MKDILISEKTIEQKIYFIHGEKVMLDKDLAELYGVSTGRLNKQVKRNIQRFPSDFMFQLTWEEVEFSRSQIVTLKRGRNIKYLPYVFTEHGVAMLSSVLKSERAIQVNIAIMRTFAKLKEILSTHKELTSKLKELEHKVGKHGQDIQLIFEAIRQLMAPPQEVSKRKIGFHADWTIDDSAHAV